jgi:hypothetical protein
MKRKRTKSESGRLARRKGAAFEREIASVFRIFGWRKARRNLQPQGGKVVGGDIVGIPFDVECKRTKKLAIGKKMRDAWDQLTFDQLESGKDLLPRLVVTRGDGTEAFVVTTLGDLLDLISDVEVPDDEALSN